MPVPNLQIWLHFQSDTFINTQGEVHKLPPKGTKSHQDELGGSGDPHQEGDLLPTVDF